MTSELCLRPIDDNREASHSVEDLLTAAPTWQCLASSSCRSKITATDLTHCGGGTYYDRFKALSIVSRKSAGTARRVPGGERHRTAGDRRSRTATQPRVGRPLAPPPPRLSPPAPPPPARRGCHRLAFGDRQPALAERFRAAAAMKPALWRGYRPPARGRGRRALDRTGGSTAPRASPSPRESATSPNRGALARNRPVPRPSLRRPVRSPTQETHHGSS